VRSVAKVVAMTLVIGGLIASGVAFATSARVGHPTRSRPRKVPGSNAAVPDGAPKKYVVVSSGGLSAPQGTRTRGTMDCPAGTVVWGGGVVISSRSLHANINSSFPAGTDRWIGDVNNRSGAGTTFAVYAVCANRNTGYSVHTVTTIVPSHGQFWALATCPTGSRILGGGGSSSSTSTTVNMNSSYPYQNGWIVYENNGLSHTTKVTAYAICGRANGRQVVAGPAVANPAGTQTEATVQCPAPKVPISGGAESSGFNGVNLNTTTPSPTGWISFENNATTGFQTVTPHVICAGT
jgi:hypothetical protein